MQKPEIWAHRGASSEFAENTIPAFVRAIELGVDGIELDVQLTSDQEIVVAHDESTQRTTRKSGQITEMTSSQLKQLNAAAFRANLEATQIPLLDEVLSLAKPTAIKLNIELKNNLVPMPGLEKLLWQKVTAAAMEKQVIFSSFNHFSIRTLLAIGADASCGLLFNSVIPDPWLYTQRVGAKAIHPRFSRHLSSKLIADCHAQQISVHTWTLNSEQDILRAAQLNVDAIITDKPKQALSILRKQHQE